MAAGMYRRCPLCGREEYGIAASRADCNAVHQSQARQLSYHLEALEAGQLTIQYFREHITNMCSLCQMLMIGICSEADELELRERISKAMETLRSDFAQAA